MEGDRPALDDTRKQSCWLRPEVVFLVALVIAAYFSMLTALPVRGEESRWARVATEMLETGDWIVPRQQGEPFLDRPPLGPWTMALVGWARGRVDLVAIRLPSVLATLATTLLIYGYSCRSLSRLGAFAAGATYASFGLVHQLGWTGENEAVYTLLLGGALLLWHTGLVRSWPPALIWSVGYGLAALATLVKGPQAPVYFVAVTTVYLLVQRREAGLVKREASSKADSWRLTIASYLAGIGAFALIVGLWLVPLYLRTGWQSVLDILTQTSAIRYGTDGLLAHLALYPLEVWVSLLPGTVVLVGLAYPRLFRQMGAAPAEVRFALVGILVTFPSVWLAQEARPRYFMPLSACVAVIVGWTIERLVAPPRVAGVPARAWRGHPALESKARRLRDTRARCPRHEAPRFWWRFCMFSAAAGIGGFAVVLSLAGHTGSASLAAIAPPLSQAVAYVAILLAIAGVLAWSALRVHARSALIAVAALAVFQGLLFRGLVTGALSRNANDLTGIVANLRRELPADVRLVSFGIANHRFAYHYQTMIGQLAWPQSEADVPSDVTYFCFDPAVCPTLLPFDPNASGAALQEASALPFEWECIAWLNTGRNRSEVPEEITIIGRIVRRR
ncbi:MAG: glycosyltransferase family 39 protein [Sedimentisphaerales bacterium]|nr:glycosyltransferase family 39 protein [Sedimentisphaerales bacterium]